MSSTAQVVLAVAVYLAVVSVLGILAARRSSSSPEEYFLAGRRLRTLVLFMALFGTNCTSFVLVGIPGLAFHSGIGVFGLNASIVALGVPLTFFAIGAPARRMAARLGAVTPAELLARRLGSRAVGALLFVAFTVYTVPYMVQGVKAAGIGLSQASGGALSEPVIGLALIAVVLLYTSLGGMRGTAWTNVFQGTLFLGFMMAAFFLVAGSLGGFRAAMERVREVDPALLRIEREGLFEPRRFASWGIVIATTVIAFPHMLVRLMAASSEGSLRTVCRLYPPALILLWVPAVLLGVWGRGAFPDLSEPDLVFQRVAMEHLPALGATLAFLAVLAAVMSTLDAQILTLSSMLLRDVVKPLRPGVGEEGEVRAARLFTLGIAALVYALSLTWGESVFEISRRAFEGYTTIVPTLLLGVRWRRFTAAGAAASILSGNALLAAGWIWPGLPTLGFLPVFWAFLAAFGAGIVVSLAGPPPDEARTELAFGGPARPGQSSSPRK